MSVLEAMTNTGAKRLGVSCAVIGAAVFLVIVVRAEDPYRISRLAEQSLLEERAERMGLDTYQAERRIRDECAKKYANWDLSAECYNAEMFGGFGEILDRRRGLIRAEYYGTSLLAMLAVAAMAFAGAWFFIAFVVPACLSYWAWLRGR
jgi:hypothetical protein